MQENIFDKMEIIITSPVTLALVLLLTVLSSAPVSAVNATGSEYSIGEFSSGTVISSTGNGTDYSGSSAKVASAITIDAQGLEYGGVVGITGHAILVPDKVPIINSYSLIPDSVNQSSPVRMFISAVYTNRVLVNITRPNNVVDTMNMGSQSIYYYPYTDIVGRYIVRFIAEGNSVVTADDYFDVVAAPSPPPEEPEEERRGGSGGSSIAMRSRMYVSASIYCTDTTKIVVEVTNDTSPIRDVLITLKSEYLSVNSSSDEYGTAMFDVASGNYTISAYHSKYGTVRHTYDLHCPEKDETDAAYRDASGESLQDISGNAVSDVPPATTGEVSAGACIEEPARTEAVITPTGYIIIFLTSMSSTLMFLLILFVFLYNHRASKSQMAEVSVINYPVTYSIQDSSDMPVNTPVGFGIYYKNVDTADGQKGVEAVEKKAKKALTAVEEAMLATEKEIVEAEKAGPDKAGMDKAILKTGASAMSKDGKSMPSRKEPSKEKTLETAPSLSSQAVMKPIVKAPHKQKQRTEHDVNISPVSVLAPKPGLESFTSKPASSKPASVPAVTSSPASSVVVNSFLSNVPQGMEFVLCNGEKIYSLPGLLLKLRVMDDRIFNCHVTPYKNDFATWIYHAVGDKGLAGRIGPIKSKNEMVHMISASVDLLDWEGNI